MSPVFIAFWQFLFVFLGGAMYISTCFITSFHMIATIVAIGEKKNSSAIVRTIDGFHMIAAAIATIAEKVNEDRGDLRLTTSFAPRFVKFNLAPVNRLFLLEGCCCFLFFFYLWMFFNVDDDGKDKEPIDFGFERSSRRGNLGILLSETQ